MKIITFVIENNYKMKPIEGQYFYARHRNRIGVWKWDKVWDNGASGDFIADFNSREDARVFVWQMNGWGIPEKALDGKQIIRNMVK